MGQLDAITRTADVEQLVPDVAVQRRQPGHELAAAPEIERVQQVEHDARCLFEVSAPAHQISTLELALGARQLAQELLVLLRNAALDRRRRVDGRRWSPRRE